MAGWFGRLFGGHQSPLSNVPWPGPGDQFVCIDFETTGLKPSESRVIEIGAIRFNPSKELQTTFQTLVNPGVEVPKKITEITGITTAQIRRHDLPPEHAFEDLYRFIGDLPLIAYNAPFDAKFLSAEWLRLGIRGNNEYQDILALARETLSLRSYKLADVAKHLGVEVEPDHRALSDAHAALLIYDNLRQLTR
ncbi:MAG: PolC-type DNA polymerase III [Minwuia sp.]|uniref:3'-5' exonuclease n=1 Tax=Minwuia sp. TaxID=2493630 RepID=UPI003A87D1A6